ncbi:MAG: HlyD family efflux transporter periplasmic adaptor subunit [Fuerstiella sp.]
MCLFLLVLTGANDKSMSLSDDDFGVIQLKPTEFLLEMERQGIIEPAASTEVRSECFWKTEILSLVPEGTWVQEGDVVCVLDASQIEEYARSRESTLIRYRGLLDNALHDEKMLATASERTLAAAEFKFTKAEENSRVYSEANFPESVRQLEDDLQLQNTRLLTLQDDARHVERLWLMGVTTSTEMSRTSLSLMNAEQEQAKLQSQLDLLTGFSHPRASLMLDHGRTNAARNVLRTQLKNSLSATKARLSRLAWERRVRIYEKYHKRALDSIEACVLRAPRSGQVIYGNSWWERSRGITRVEEGKIVRRDQTVFEIPEPRKMKVSVPVDEALVYRVSPGMELAIVPKGYPDVIVAGQIRSVARYPRARSRYTPGIKDYWVDVELMPTEDQFKYLSPKADVSVGFVLENRSDKLVIPRDSVTGVSGHNFVFVLDDGELVSRKVQLGQANQEQVCIEGGLVEGDKLVTSMTEQHQKRLFDTLSDDLGVPTL